MVKPQITIKDKELLEYFASYVWWENKEEIITHNPLRKEFLCKKVNKLDFNKIEA